MYLERQLTKPLDAFVEYAGDCPQRGESKQLGSPARIGYNRVNQHQIALCLNACRGAAGSGSLGHGNCREGDVPFT
jgi:hypothetical protein